jgi:hypothetical protein
MPTFRIQLTLPDIILTDADIDALPYFAENRLDEGGATAELARERAFLEKFIRERLDYLVGWEMEQRGTNWRLQGSLVTAFTGTGSFTAPNLFNDSTNPFTPGSNPVGKIIRVPAGQTPAGRRNARGRYRITNRINNGQVEIEGVIPNTSSGLDWEYRNFGNTDAIAILDAV